MMLGAAEPLAQLKLIERSVRRWLALPLSSELFQNSPDQLLLPHVEPLPLNVLLFVVGAVTGALVGQEVAAVALPMRSQYRCASALSTVSNISMTTGTLPAGEIDFGRISFGRHVHTTC